MQNMLLRIETTGKYTHYKQVKVVYLVLHRKGNLTIAKTSRLSYIVVVSLPLESILSKMSRYEADFSNRVHQDISSGLICKNYYCCLIGNQ
jgi:hypothetical protein